MTAAAQRKPTEPAPGTEGARVIDFHRDAETYRGVDAGDRQWQITPVFTGWRLEFLDPGDVTPTYAGTHSTLAAAQAEAAR